MSIEINNTYHLVKSEDLNHHGTLYAGRTAEWFVEAGFIAAARMTNPENIVCLKIHGMQFSSPVRKGEILCLECSVVFAGKTSLIVLVHAKRDTETLLRGFITFVHVDENGRSTPHHVNVDPDSPEERAVFEEAKNLRK